MSGRTPWPLSSELAISSAALSFSGVQPIRGDEPPKSATIARSGCIVMNLPVIEPAMEWPAMCAFRDLQMVEQSAHIFSDLDTAARGFVRLVALAVSAHIERDDAELLRELVDDAGITPIRVEAR
jgi:hypothetical protein